MPWVSPFSLPGRWLKGNLHTHTTQSDGLRTPEQAIAWYRDHGYDFLAITDHWILTPGQDQRPAADFVTVTGAELHGARYHMLALGIATLPDQSQADEPQAMADAVAAQGGLAFVAHPYWTGQTSCEVAQIGGLAGIEVFNSVCEQMNGLGHARVHWDDLLARGARLSGLAVDDVHWKYGEVGRGFVMVKAECLREACILQALRLGHFYASTGPQIHDLGVISGADGQPALRVACSPCRRITFHARGPAGRRFEAPADERLTSASWPIQAEQVYLRVECQDNEGGVAWSNPVFVADILASCA